MDFYELEVFKTLAETLHFSRTALKVNLSPSALSRLISRLEEEAGTELFDRDNRKVTLTQAGKEFLAFSTKVLKDKEDISYSLSRKNNSVSGTLPVYASVTACYTILPEFIKILSARYPLVHLSVQTGDPADALNAVKEGRAVIAVAAIPEEGFSSIETHPVKRTPLIYAASADGPYTNIYGSPQDIVSSVPLILPKAGLARKRFDKWTKSRNVKPVIAAETEGNEAILAIAQLGLGIGLVPRIVLENGPYKGKFVIHEAGNALGYYDVGFIRKKEITGTQNERRIYNVVTEVLSELLPQ